MKYYSATKRYELLIYTTCVNLKTKMNEKRAQSKKEYIMHNFIKF